MTKSTQIKYEDRIASIINFHTKEQASTAKQMVIQAQQRYEKRKPCKFFVVIVMMAFGSFLIVAFQKMVTFMSNSLYDRQAIEALMRDMIGKR